MRFFLVFILTFLSFPAFSSTPPNNDAFFEKKMQTVGKSLDQTAEEVRSKVKTAVNQADAKASRHRKDIRARLGDAFGELSEGFERAWRRLKGNQ